MGLHKIIDDGGEKYLPFALHRMRQLVGEAAASWGTASRVIYADDGSVIRLSVNGEEQHLRITTGGVRYQFTTTGPFVRVSPSGAGLGVDALHNHAVRVAAGAGSVTAKPFGSTVEPDPEPGGLSGPRWKYSADPMAISQMLPMKNIWQLNSIPEHVYYGRSAGSKEPAAYPWLVNSWSANTQWVGMQTSSAADGPLGTIDIMFDAAPSLFRDRTESEPLGTLGAAPDADWYRRAALCRATHEQFGTRLFIVLTDVSNRFYVYPAGAEIDQDLRTQASASYQQQQIKTNVPGRFVKSAQAPLPPWCREPRYVSRDSRPDLSDEFRNTQYVADVPQYVWQFNSTGSKACCIVFEELEPLPLEDGSKPLLGGLPPNVGEEVREALPGLVEVSLKISLTGSNPEDFNFALATEKEIRPSTDGRYFVAAGYSWTVPALAQKPPPDKPPPNTADTDDFIVITGHVYHTSSERERLGERVAFSMYAAKGILRVRNLTKGTIVREFLVYHRNHRYIAPWSRGGGVDWLEGGSPYTEAFGRLLAYDLRILAFAVQQQYMEQEWWVSPSYGQQHAERRQAQRLQVYAYNKLVQQKNIDPGTPLNAGLASLYADVGHEGLFEYPINDVGTYDPTYTTTPLRDPSQSVYSQQACTALRGTYRTEGANGKYLRTKGPYHAGALAYAQMIYPSVGSGSANPYESFTVHPSGSWSFASLPVVYFAGPRPLFGEDSEDIDLSLMRQGMVDIISFRVGKKDVLTTHRRSFNKAFDKALEEKDFLYEFTKHTSTAPGDLFLRFLGIRTPADPQTGVDHSAYIPIGTSRGANYLNATDPYSIDMRHGFTAYSKVLDIYEVTPGSPHRGYYTEPRIASHIRYRTPFVRGSSLFF